MDYRLLGFFSGFPNHSFPQDVAKRLSKELTNRKNLIFVTAWPEDYVKNDSDSIGMHGMFEKCNIHFAQHFVIDNRMEASQAKQLIYEASCVFLMGGHPGLQLQLIHDKDLGVAICDIDATVLGVSAGAINMAINSFDTKESLVPYSGLGLADITIKPHFEPENKRIVSKLLQISKNLPIYAMEDDSAIFVVGDRISSMGDIHLIHQGKMCPIWQGTLVL